jgi:hypothetical protein
LGDGSVLEYESRSWDPGAIQMEVDRDPATGLGGFRLTQTYVASSNGAVSEMLEEGYMCSFAPIIKGDGSVTYEYLNDTETSTGTEFDPAAHPDRCLKGSSATMSASLADLPAGEYLVGFIAKDVLNNTSVISTTLTR